jgi:HAMP domain-containing protein
MHRKQEVRSRRNLKSTLVEPFKQVKLGLYVIVISLTFLVCAASTIFYAFFKQYEHVMEIFNVVDPSIRWELVTNDIFQQNAKILVALCVTYIGILFTVVFKMTHKIYGPLVGIERFVDQLTESEFRRRVTIRRGDELERLAGKLNRLAESLERRYGAKERRGDDDDDLKAC